MRFIFKGSAPDTEIVLPVTPKGFEITDGINIELVNVHTIGDVIIGGYGTLCTIKVDCIFPAQKYPFSAAVLIRPYEYVETLKKLCDAGRVLRFIVSDTPVNVPVLIKDIKYGEKDGTGDVYATITLREYRKIEAVQTQKQERTQNETREESSPPTMSHSYVVVRGDTMWAISRRFYGEPRLCYPLAAFNNIPNANILHVGQILNIPDKSLLA